MIATGLPVLIAPVGVLELDARVGSPNFALQALVPVLLQVIWIEFAVPSESYTVIELVKVAPVAASDGRFATIEVLVVGLALVGTTSVLTVCRLAADVSPTTSPPASVRQPSRKKPPFSR